MINSRLKHGLIVLTDHKCVLKGQTFSGIPTIVWPEGVDEQASDWLRDLVVKNGLKQSSAGEYANMLRPFLRFCRSKNRSTYSVDDNFIIIWREFLRRDRKLSISRINTVMMAIFSFYQWAEENGRLRFGVGIYSFDEMPEDLRGKPFPISARKTFRKGSSGKVFSDWTTPLLLPGARQGAKMRHTPTELETRRAHEIASGRSLGDRDTLLFSWAEEVGTRRAEMLRIRKSHLPGPHQLERLLDDDTDWRIEIERKGGAFKSLFVSPELIIRTLDYVEYARADVVADCRRRIAGYREPEEVFLSARTGLVLHPDSVTSMGRRTFDAAGIANANIHRFRAKKAVQVVEMLLEAMFEGESIGPTSTWIETILTKASEQMGHMSPSSLRPYLTYVLNRRIVNSEAYRRARKSAKVRQLEARARTLQDLITKRVKLLEKTGTACRARPQTIARVLEALAAEIGDNHVKA